MSLPQKPKCRRAFARNGVDRIGIPSAPADIQQRLATLGVEALKREAQSADVARIRRASGMTQEEFAATYGFSTASIRNWEQHRSEPDSGARAFLRVIETHPDIAAEAVTV